MIMKENTTTRLMRSMIRTGKMTISLKAIRSCLVAKTTLNRQAIVFASGMLPTGEVYDSSKGYGLNVNATFRFGVYNGVFPDRERLEGLSGYAMSCPDSLKALDVLIARCDRQDITLRVFPVAYRFDDANYDNSGKRAYKGTTFGQLAKSPVKAHVLAAKTGKRAKKDSVKTSK
jgi:hypothetical protein